MARKDKPYLPLYVQDFLTDEKLMECSAASTGVYVRIMCVMHKSVPYGSILLKQKDKQTIEQIDKQIDKQILYFASKLARHFPWSLLEICLAIQELICEQVLYIDGDFLIQKRMFEDGKLSITRSLSGSEGGKKTQKINRDFAKAKIEANTDIDIICSITKILEDTNTFNGQAESEKTELVMVVIEMMKKWMEHKPDYDMDKEVDYPALLNIAYYIAEKKGWKKSQVVFDKEYDVVESWVKVLIFLKEPKTDAFFKRLTIDGVSNRKNMQKIVEAMKVGDFAIKQRQEALEKNRITPEQYFSK